MSTHEEEKPMPQTERGDEKDDLSRRQFISDVAIKAAVAALFGAVTFDSVMARAMDRVNEVRSIRRVGVGAADDLHAAGVSPQCSQYVCKDYSYGGSGSTATCYNTFDCFDTYGCTIRKFDCVNTFTCESTFNCKGGDYYCDQEPSCAAGATYNVC